MLIDTHCHLTDEKLEPKKAEIVKNLLENQIEAVVDVGCDYASSMAAVQNSIEYDNVYSAVGIHPHDAKNRKNSDYADFEKQTKNKKVVAIGEIGLDYFYDLSPRDVQIQVFREQIELAHALKLPIIFHLRDAYLDFLKIVKDEKNYLEYGGVLHCYSGSSEYMTELRDFDFYYGFDGPITYKNARHSIEALLATDIRRVLFETDSPYLSPVPLRGSINMPNNLSYIVEKASLVLNLPKENLVDISTQNAKTLFNRIK